MRPKNEILGSDTPHIYSNFRGVVCVFQSATPEDGETTIDPSKAALNVDGSPIVLKTEPGGLPLPGIASPVNSLSLSYDDPASRMAALSAIGLSSGKHSSPQLYFDKFDAFLRVESAAKSLINKLKIDTSSYFNESPAHQ